MNPGPLGKQPVFLTAEPFLHSLFFSGGRGGGRDGSGGDGGGGSGGGGGVSVQIFIVDAPAIITTNSVERRIPIFLHPQHHLLSFLFFDDTNFFF